MNRSRSGVNRLMGKMRQERNTIRLRWDCVSLNRVSRPSRPRRANKTPTTAFPHRRIFAVVRASFVAPTK